MANEILSTTTANDQEKFLASKLLERSHQKLVCASICDKVAQPKGAGQIAYFVRYARMNVPLAALTEGTDPSNSTFALEQVTVTLDQWGALITLTDVAQLTTKHPLLAQAMELLAENAQRVIDREIQVVWLAGTNVQYGDGSVTTRATVTAAMKISDTVLNKARVSLIDGGAPPKGGPSGGTKAAAASGNIMGAAAYVVVAGPQVIADIMTASASFGTWAAVQTYGSQKALYNAEVGTWLGFRFVETNFIPKFKIFGNTTTAVASGGTIATGLVVTAVDGGGSLTSATTYYYKAVRKDLTRGFAEEISIEHTTDSAATGNNESFTFAFPSTATYAYDLYFGSATGDSNLKLVQANIAAGTTVTVTAVPSSTTTAPANTNITGLPTIHPVYIHGAESCAWVGLQNLEVMLSKDEASTHNPLKLRRTLSYKFLGKAVIKDQTRMLRLEVASTY